MWPWLLWGPPEAMTGNQQVCPRMRAAQAAQAESEGCSPGNAFQAEPPGVSGHLLQGFPAGK